MPTFIDDRARHDLVALRRDLHRVPELGLAEHETGRRLRAIVERYAAVRSIAGTGLVADIGPADAPLTLLLRADMDGLPIGEETGLDFASRHPGLMHACGHDAHMAALAVAGRLVAARPPRGLRVRLLFQPGEEGRGGALRCIEEGVLEGVDVAFGLHLWSGLPVGQVAVGAGGVMAGAVELTLRVVGRGGHGGMPEQTRDALVAGADLVAALQTVVSRRMSPLEPVVLSLGAFHAGEAFNVIAETAELRGTVRTLSPAAERAVEGHVREIAAGIGATHGVAVDVDWRVHCVPVVNDAGVAATVRAAAEATGLFDAVPADARTMGAEDFGYVLERVPGCFVFVGAGPADGSVAEPHHSPRFTIDEAALPLACALHGAVVAEVAARGRILVESRADR